MNRWQSLPHLTESARLATATTLEEGEIRMTVCIAPYNTWSHESLKCARDEVDFLLNVCKFSTPKEATEVICRYLLADPSADPKRPKVRAATCSALHHADEERSRSVLAETTFMETEVVTTREEDKPFGRVDIIYESAAFGVYLLRLSAHSAIPWHIHNKMDEAEFALTSKLLLNEKTIARGFSVKWPKGFAHSYMNPTADEQVICCVDQPAFIPSDEILVPKPSLKFIPSNLTRQYPSGWLANGEC
jgi:dihydroneopterin aldolase